MCLPVDMRAYALRSALDGVADALKAAGLDSAQAAFLLDDARRHALELETALRPVPAPSSPPPRPARRFIGHGEAGSNVITLRAG